MTAHTPGKLEVGFDDGSGSNETEFDGQSLVIPSPGEGEDILIADIWLDSLIAPEQRNANAVRLCLCWNEFDNLLVACDDAHDAIVTGEHHDRTSVDLQTILNRLKNQNMP